MFKFEFKKNSRRRSARNFEIGQVHSMGKTILSKILPPQPPPPLPRRLSFGPFRMKVTWINQISGNLFRSCRLPYELAFETEQNDVFRQIVRFLFPIIFSCEKVSGTFHRLQ